MKFKKLKIKINLISNVKIINNFEYSNIKINKKLICKNFIFFLILIQYFYKFNNLNIKLHFKKTKNKNITVLRPPYRHKLSRHQLNLQRFNTAVFIKFYFKNELLVNSLNQLLIFTNFIKNQFKWLESNIIYNSNTKYNFNFIFKNYFIL